MSNGDRVISGLYRRIIAGYTIEMGVDVDGTYPQMKCRFSVVGYDIYFIAHMESIGNSKWEGNVGYNKYEEDGSVDLDGQKIVKLYIEYFINFLGKQTISFHCKKDTGTVWYNYLYKVSDYFRETQLELDYEQGVGRLLTYDTSSLDRPAGVAAEELTLEKIYGRAGIEITRSSALNQVASSGSGWDQKWSNQELHDAMIANWSRKEGDPWAMWVFFAKYHVDTDTLGIMFDQIGAYERSGTAIFSKAIADYYSSEAEDKRNHFSVMIHEIGHGFNLVHSWQKTLGTKWTGSVADEADAASFMNYDWKYPGGAAAYWRDFTYRFSDQELLFLRHAPESYVSMGGSAFGADHASQAPTMELMQEMSQQDRKPATLQLDIRVNKQRPVFEFMEPVNIELKLKNISEQPREVDKAILEDIGHMTINITRDRSETKEYRSYSQPCHAHEKMTLDPGESLYSTLFLSAGSLGWYIADPGMYEITVALSAEREDHDDKEIVSSTFSLIVLRPSIQRRREEEKLAQDVFNDDVGRILAFQGSHILGSGNDILHELTDRFPQANAVTHAEVALEVPKLKDFKKMEFKDGQNQVKIKDAKLEEASQKLQKVLVDKGAEAANTLGNIGFQQLSGQLSQELSDKGADETAVAVEENVLKVMNQRGVKLPKKVKDKIESKVESLKNKRRKRKGKRNKNK